MQRTSTDPTGTAALSQLKCKCATRTKGGDADHRREPQHSRSGSHWARKSSLLHHNRYRQTWHDRDSPNPSSSREGVDKYCCHAKLLFWGVVSLRAIAAGYMRLRMGCYDSDRDAGRDVHREASDLRCSAFCTRAPSVGKLAAWSRWSR